MTWARGTRGVTLVELMVVLVVLGLMAGVVGLAWRHSPASQDTERDAIARARVQALESGATVRFQVTLEGQRVMVAALPDGSVIAPAGLHLDRLTGTTVRE
jgi:prepilin-type N-terminal cleavage/methylation domain-containing protein